MSSEDGIPSNNRLVKRVGPLINVQQLRDIFLFGITIRNDQGEELKEEAYQVFIDNAISMLEHYLDIYVTEELIVEHKDYRQNDYAEWGYLQLNNFPVREIQKVEMVFFRNEDGEPQVIQEIPKSWMRLQKEDGILRLVPNTKFPGNLQIDGSGNFSPQVLASSMVPHAWQITYKAGFEDGKIPNLINQAIALLAAISGLIIGGHLVLGAGISSQSLSIDGLSQSISSTNSAENSAYGANIKEYQKILFGDGPNDKENGIIHQLKEYYKGMTVGII